MDDHRSLPERLNLPSQDNLRRATDLAFETAAGQPDEQLVWLGAERCGAAWRLPVLNEILEVDLSARRVCTSAAEPVGHAWRILALHYLAVSQRPEERPCTITFADLQASRTYAGVYQGRVIGRFCATAGRDASTLQAAADALGARPVDDGDLAFDFAMFPRLAHRLVWHAPDEEFPASATILLPDNIESFFCAEDIVVLSESHVARLSGRPV